MLKVSTETYESSDMSARKKKKSLIALELKDKKAGQLAISVTYRMIQHNLLAPADTDKMVRALYDKFEALLPSDYSIKRSAQDSRPESVPPESAKEENPKDESTLQRLHSVDEPAEMASSEQGHIQQAPPASAGVLSTTEHPKVETLGGSDGPLGSNSVSDLSHKASISTIATEMDDQLVDVKATDVAPEGPVETTKPERKGKFQVFQIITNTTGGNSVEEGRSRSESFVDGQDAGPLSPEQPQVFVLQQADVFTIPVTSPTNLSDV